MTGTDMLDVLLAAAPLLVIFGVLALFPSLQRDLGQVTETLRNFVRASLHRVGRDRSKT